MSTNVPSHRKPCPADSEVELRELLRSALPRCVMSFLFEITGFSCFVGMLVLPLTEAWLAMALGAFCLWQAHGLMRQVSGKLARVRQLHEKYPDLKARHSSVTAFVHKYARLTGHAPQR